MPIKNATTGKVIAVSSRVADSAIERSLGLMFSKPQQAALVLKFQEEVKISLHMMFVFYPIDVIFANSRKEIVDIKEGFRPFDTYASRRNAKYAIELPAGTVRETKTKVGHKIEFLSIKHKTYLNGRSVTVTKAGK